MLFQTPEFLVLLLTVLLGIGLLRRSRSGQHWLLLLASYVFYGWWDVRFLMLLLVSSVVDYAAALGVAGIKLRWGQRLAISAILLGGVALFLGINWPAIQTSASLTVSAHVLHPTWTGHRVALGLGVLLALVGPLVYELYFWLPKRSRRRAFLWTSVIANLAILGFFKYFNFFVDNLWGIGRLFGWTWEPVMLRVALPVGISFYTFQTMSYTIDVYRGTARADRSLLRVALYVAYFPQLVAGPILRPGQFLPALRQAWTLRADRLTSGFHLILVGLAKKVLIADTVAPLVDTLLSDPQGRPSLLIWVGAVMFATQIYCDFSGYTDIARGISRVFGVEIPLNFDGPYFSTSIIEFWRRWHISLSTWLRDYLYIPLGGSRCGTARLYFNLMTTMVLGGLWHGAAWNFVIWGAYQGLLLCINRPLRAIIERSAPLTRAAHHPLGVLVRWGTTTYLVLLGWLIFRVSGYQDLQYAVRHFLVFDGRWELTGLGAGTASPFTATLALGVFVLFHAVRGWGRTWPERLDQTPRSLQLLVYFVMGLVFFLAWPSQQAPFIYFRF
jgi:D-alanyl-lipoteichoic acid acyltransferase DltB (MBOAT superfamily)